MSFDDNKTDFGKPNSNFGQPSNNGFGSPNSSASFGGSSNGENSSWGSSKTNETQIGPKTPFGISPSPNQGFPAARTGNNVDVSQSPQNSKNNTYIFNADSRTIRGKISQYSSSGKEDGTYRRLLPVKLYEAIVYKQRLEDVLHRFTVRVDHGEDALGYQKYTDIPVNVHGTISGGLQLVDNAEVAVHGKYKNGVLMADSIYVINNGYESKVGFQHSVKAITYGILATVMFLFICFVVASTNGSFFANIKEFLKVWLIITVVITVLYLITSMSRFGLLTRMFSNKKRSFPLLGILLISLALTFLFLSFFGSLSGFGSALYGLIYSIVPIIIIIVALFFIIKSMF